MQGTLNSRNWQTLGRSANTVKVMSAILSLLAVCSPLAQAETCPTSISLSTSERTIGLCEHKQGLADYAAGRIEAAETHYLGALATWEKVDGRYPAEQVITLIGLGRLYQATHRPYDAARVLTRGLELARPLENTRPQLAAVILSRLGAVYSMSGRLEQARSMLNEGIAKLRALQPQDLPELAYAWNALGMAELRAGSFANGESDIRQAVSIATGCLGENDHQTVIYQTDLGVALYLGGQYSRALPLLRRAEFLLETGRDDENGQLGTALVELSAVEAAQGKYALAENDASRALAVLDRHYGPDSGEVARASVNLAAIYLVEHKTPDAEKILPNAVDTERHVFTSGRALANGLRWLAQLRAQQGHWSQAESLYREAIDMFEAGPDPPPSEIGAVRREYTKILKQERGKVHSAT